METQKPIAKLVSTPVVSCSLKRKRPPMIEIPNVLQEIQADKLKVWDFIPRNEPFCFSGIGVGVSSTKGKKKFMEDSHKIVSNKGFFGVYDGHGGHRAAEFVAENLHTNILEMMVNCPAKEDAVEAGYLKTDQEFLKQGVVSGACCVTALIQGQEIIVSNLGDCRAVLSRGGVAEALTKDHRAEREDERKRIENKGGYVEIHRGSWRVHGILSVSRSIGDAHLKDWVVAEPDTQILPLTSDMEFLVLASDGLWEEVGNQEAVDTVVRLCMHEKKPNFADIQKDDDVRYGCVNVSPSSKLKRVALKGPKNSSSEKKTVDIHKDLNFPSENESPLPKLKRVSLKGLKHPPSDKKAMDNHKDLNFPSENESPLSKLKRVSLEGLKHSPSDKKTMDNHKDLNCPSENESPLSKLSRVSLEGLKHSPSDKKAMDNHKDLKFPSENESPSSKLKRVSLKGLKHSPSDNNTLDNHKDLNFPSENESPLSKLKRVSLKGPKHSPSDKITMDNHKDLNFPSVNESPPSKLRRISLFKRINAKTDSPITEKSVQKKMATSTGAGGLVAACKELVNLAVSRGSLDDITVMIIDLNHFRCKI